MPSPMEGGHMRQSVQEWTKQNLWDIAFKKFEVTWFALTDISNFKFYFKSSTNFTWSITEYFGSYQIPAFGNTTKNLA